jgi:MFS family permease
MARKQEMRVQNLLKANAGLLFAGVATFILMGAGQALYGPALPAFSRSFGLGLGTAGLVISAHWIGCALGVAGMFWRGPQVSPRHVIVMMGLGSALVASGLGWPAVLLGAMVFGAGYGCATVVFNPRMLRAFGPRGTAMLSLLNATFGIGAIGAPLLFVALGNDPFLAFAAFAGFAALIWLGAGPASRPEAAAVAVAVKPFRLHLPILAFCMVAIGLEATLIGLGPAALIAAGETEIHAAQLLSLFFLAFLAARVTLTFTAHLLPAFTLYTVALTAAFVAAVGAALLDPGACFVILGACAGMFFPGGYVTATHKMGHDPRVPPTIIAAGLIGGIAAPLILSPFLEAMGERGFFWIIALLAGGLSLAAWINLRRMNH